MVVVTGGLGVETPRNGTPPTPMHPPAQNILENPEGRAVLGKRGDHPTPTESEEEQSPKLGRAEVDTQENFPEEIPPPQEDETGWWEEGEEWWLIRSQVGHLQQEVAELRQEIQGTQENLGRVEAFLPSLTHERETHAQAKQFSKHIRVLEKEVRDLREELARTHPGSTDPTLHQNLVQEAVERFRRESEVFGRQLEERIGQEVSRLVQAGAHEVSVQLVEQLHQVARGVEQRLQEVQPPTPKFPTAEIEAFLGRAFGEWEGVRLPQVLAEKLAQTSVSELCTSTVADKRLEVFEKRFGDTEKRFVSLEANISRIESLVGGMGKRQNEFESTLRAAGAGFEKLKVAVIGLGTKAQDLQQTQQKLLGQVQMLTQETTTRVDKLGSESKKVDRRLQTLEEHCTTLGQKEWSLENGVGHLQAEVDEIKNRSLVGRKHAVAEEHCRIEKQQPPQIGRVDASPVVREKQKTKVLSPTN